MKKNLNLYVCVLGVLSILLGAYVINGYDQLNQILFKITYDELNRYSYEELKNIKEDLLLESKENSKANCILGYIEYKMNDYDSSLEYFYEVINNKTDYLSKELAYIGVMQIYFDKREIDLGESTYRKLQQLYKKYDNHDIKWYGNIVYSRKLIESERYNDAISILKASVNLNVNYKKTMKSYALLSEVYIAIDSFEVSKLYASNALVTAYNIGEKEYIISGMLSCAQTYYYKNLYLETISICNKIIDKYDDIPLDYIIDIYRYLYKSYLDISDLESAKKIETLYKDKVEELSNKEKELEYIRIYSSLSMYYSKEGDATEALRYLELACRYRYDKNSNIYLWIEKAKLDYEYVISSQDNYSLLLYKYEELLESSQNKYLDNNLKRQIINSIIDISNVSKNYNKLKEYLDIFGIAQQNNYDLKNYQLGDMIEEFESEVTYKSKREVVYKLIIIGMTCIFFLFFVIRSIKIQKLNYELKELTEIDSLTQLKNKRYIYNYLSRLVGTNQEVIVSVMDIDYFKLYNDNYGHIKGDYILKTVADIIHNSFKDDVVGRFGGEEFCVVSIRNYSQFKEDVIEFMMKLEKHNIKHEYSPIEKRITVSVGVERDVLRRQIHIDNLIEKSDKNMYISKINGRNKYTF